MNYLIFYWIINNSKIIDINIDIQNKIYTLWIYLNLLLDG